MSGVWTASQQPAPTTTPTAAPATATVALADDVVAGIKRHSPELDTYLGLPDAEHGRTADNSLEARARRWAEEDGWRTRLAAIDATALTGTAWVIHGFLQEVLETSFANRICETELWNVDQMGGWQANYGQIAQMQPIDSDALQQQALARFRALGTYADREMANLREGLRRGYSAPQGNVEKVIKQMNGLVADDSPYFSPAERTKVPAFAAAWREMIRSELTPAFRRYQGYLRNEYLSLARRTVAVSALPNGAACYQARLRDMTSLSLSPDDVHKMGLDELERIKAVRLAYAAATNAIAASGSPRSISVVQRSSSASSSPAPWPIAWIPTSTLESFNVTCVISPSSSGRIHSRSYLDIRHTSTIQLGSGDGLSLTTQAFSIMAAFH
jgi:uncharacterized protein (DUF885 family)